MANINAATAVAKVLKEEGVEWYAGVHGGHIWQLMGQIATGRHQNVPHAA